jgi:ATP-dependent RNA helicase SUPV3L1/SUV3
MAAGRKMVRTLWDACQIPDFRKLADDSHARFCGRVFGHIAKEGHLPAPWLDGQVAALDRADGDIDTLMQRLSGVRVWSYIAARPDWVRDATGMQERTRAVEDKLSDALHEKLTARFVDRRSALLIRRLENQEGDSLLSAVTPHGEVVVEGHSVGQIEGFTFIPDPTAEGEEKRLVLRAARRSLRQEMPRRVEALAAAADAAFTLSLDGRIAWGGGLVGRLRPGPALLRPQMEVTESEHLDGAQRERVRTRLQLFAATLIQTELAPIWRLQDAPGQPADLGLRGPLHQLTEAGGVAPAISLQPAQRAALKALGVRAGRFGLFMPAMVKPRAMALRALLWAVAQRVAQPSLPAAGIVSLPMPADWPPGFAAAMGWMQAGPVLLRLDVAERVAAELAHATRRGPTALPPNLSSRLSVRGEQVPAVLRALGVRIMPATVQPPEAFGPPGPPMLAAGGARMPAAKPGLAPPPPARPDSPFAALAALRHS